MCVRGQVTDDEVIISVTDDGQGIPLREQERIFERFQRLDNSADRAHAGRGTWPLHLPRHCRGAWRAHLGAQRAGRGSTFSFSLPRVRNPDMPNYVFGGDDASDRNEMRQNTMTRQEPADGQAH